MYVFYCTESHECQYDETFYTEFRLNRPSSTEIADKVNLHLSVKSVTASIFMQLMPYRYVLVRHSYIAFHENPTNYLVVNRGLKTDRQTERQTDGGCGFHMRRPFLSSKRTNTVTFKMKPRHDYVSQCHAITDKI
jgi:hypothetical protein